MASEIQAASQLLEQLLATDPPDVAKVDPIRDAEHRCDAITHDAIQRLHRTFITPFDREDLYALATTLGISTTHTITGAIVGVGATRRLSAVRWGVAGKIVWAWVLTIPMSAAIGAMTFWVVKLCGGR